MDSTNSTSQHRQHFNLSETAKQMLAELAVQRYPGKQRRQSQLVEDLITEAFAKERDLKSVAAQEYEQQRHSKIVRETPRPSLVTRFNRSAPMVLFADIAGFDTAKMELRSVIAYLRSPYRYEQKMRGVLLIGPEGEQRSALVTATVAEAKAAVARVSCSALVDMLNAAHGSKVNPDARVSEYERIVIKRDGVQGYLRLVFAEAKQAAPTLIWLDQLDAVARLQNKEEQAHILILIRREMQTLEVNQQVVVLATMKEQDTFTLASMRSGPFERIISMETPPTFPKHGIQSEHLHADVLSPLPTLSVESVYLHLCPSCRREMRPNWKHCVYCGASLATVCSRCGAPLPDIEGARFCFECGSEL